MAKKQRLEAELGLNTQPFDVGLKKASSLISKLTPVLSGVTAVFAGFLLVMKSTEATSDKLTIAIASVKGGYQGLMQTIATGDWGGLIDNITKTAKAYKDLAAAQEMNQDVEASNVVKKSYLQSTLQSARVAAASAQSPELKKQYLQEAIDAQKAITSIEKSEIAKRLSDHENYFKTVTGLDEESSELMIKNFRKIAGNYDTFYGEGGQLAFLKIQKESLAYKDQLGILNQVEKAQYNQIRAAVANLELFKQMQDKMGPDKFNEYVKELGAWNNAIAEGDQALVRLTQSITNADGKLTNLHKKLLEFYDAKLKAEGKDKVPTDFGETNYSKSLFRFGANSATDSSFKKITKELSDQQQAVMDLSETFAGFFSNVDNGFQGMIDGVISGIKRLVVELLAKAAILAILSAITGVPMPALNTILPSGIGNLMGGTIGGGSASGIAMASAPAGSERLVATLRGKDIDIALKRYNG